MSDLIAQFVNIDFTLINILAQTNSSGGAEAAGGGILGLIIGLVGYVFGSYCFQKIFQRLGMANAWLAWVPIANTWMMLRAGDQSGWWLVALLIPFVNIVGFVFLIIAFVNIMKKLGKSPWLMLLFIVPLVNFWLMYHLAFN